MKMHGILAGVCAVAGVASAQQVMWKDNPITGKVVGLTYGTSGWNAAEAQAVAYGGHLVTVRDLADETWLISSFASEWPTTESYPVYGFGPWIGLNDELVEGDWRWVSGESSGYRNWSSGTGEPNDANGGEDYAQFGIQSLQWRWNDNSGVHRTRALIEVSARPPRSWSWTVGFGAGSQSLYSQVYDFDSDGDLDLIVPAQDQVRFLRNNGAGMLAENQVVVGCGSATALAACDADYDGDIDVIVTDFSNGRRLLLITQGAGGVFQAPVVLATSGERPHGVAYGDLNSDGLGDLLVTYDGTGVQARVLPGLPGGGFAAATQQLSGLVASGAAMPTLGDIDGDGRLDAIVAGGWDSGATGTGLRILRQGSNGVLATAASLNFGFCLRAAVADLDGDGDGDIVASEGQGSQLRMFSNQGAFSFQPLPTMNLGARGYWTTVADVDGDSDLDVAVSCPDQSQVQLWLRGASGGYTRDHVLQTAAYTSWISVADMNGDLKPDVIASNRDAGSVSVVLNQGYFDCNGNGIDDPVEVAAGTAPDCNANYVPDACESVTSGSDCNGNSVFDVCELSGVTDCNGNGRLDVCEPLTPQTDCDGNGTLDACQPLSSANDCNTNGQLDICEVLAGAPDCNFNNRPDSCDVAAGAPDCNLNAVPDDCDIGVGTSIDADLNSIPDECSLDCNANGLLDTAEVAAGLVPDCNANGIPDSCDVAGAVPDCNANGVPDSCDVATGGDCNANGQPDSCELAGGAADCNGNSVLDVCDLAAGGGDCNANQQLDSCELAGGASDCNGNGTLDSCDVAAGAADCDGNGVPDVCQPLDASNDCDLNGVLDVCDVLAGATNCNGDQVPDVCQVDANGDGVLDECQDGGTAYCFGNGAGSTPCPCGGVGAAGAGCPNAANPNGARLEAVGLPSRIVDSLVLQGSGMPPAASVLYFQGTSQAQVAATGNFGTVFGDGLRCAAGATVRLGFRTNVAGASAIPSAGSPALHVVGQVPATGAVTRYYQAWYRDASPTFCTTNRYNLTNGVAVVWVP